MVKLESSSYRRQLYCNGVAELQTERSSCCRRGSAARPNNGSILGVRCVQVRDPIVGHEGGFVKCVDKGRGEGTQGGNITCSQA
jgi:hypothetical protein